MSMNGYSARPQHHGRNRSAPPPPRRDPALPPLKAASDMPETGTIKFFDANRGYGFIAHSDGDVFLHAKFVAQYNLNALQLEPGTRVRFAFMKDAKRGPAADAIRLVLA